MQTFGDDFGRSIAFRIPVYFVYVLYESLRPNRLGYLRRQIPTSQDLYLGRNGQITTIGTGVRVRVHRVNGELPPMAA